jgi:hypothetical protein
MSNEGVVLMHALKSRIRLLVLAASAAVVLAAAPVASAHNRAHLILPTGECIIVGSEKSVMLPDGTLLDLRPETPADEIGTAFAAEQGGSAIEKGPCPTT